MARHTLLTVVVTLAVAVAVFAAGALVFVYSGYYNIAATEPHNAVTRWLLSSTRKNSVEAGAERIRNVPDISGQQQKHGVEHYAQTCVVCHGAPGVERGELGKGITPTPPDLARLARERTPRELFWVVKHGIKFTGMPAFGPTHSDKELWSLVWFLKQLPEMTPEQYQHITSAISKKEPKNHHAEASKNDR